MKRTLDILLTLLAAPVWLPLLALTALAVRIGMGSPVLFRQQRPGLHGRPFVLLKFRTMRVGAGTDAERLTHFGRWLRRSSLDELPQLWNVLRGEMSLVGPRPLLMEYLPRYVAGQARRHDVRPGLTGWAQAQGRNNVPWEERLRYDTWYVDHQSLWLDLRILAMTVWQVLRGRGVSAQGEATMPEFRGKSLTEVSPMKPFVIIGASGFGREILWVCGRAGLEVSGFCDDAQDKESGSYCGLPLFGSIERAAGKLGDGVRFHCAVGNNQDRKRLAERALAVGWSPVAVTDPSAIIAPDVVVGDGAFIGPFAFISCCSSLGRFALVNHHASVGHDCRLGDFAQVCPGARVSGHCEVGTGAFLGSNAVLLPTRRMGDWAVLGACALGLSEIGDGVTVARIR